MWPGATRWRWGWGWLCVAQRPSCHLLGWGPVSQGLDPLGLVPAGSGRVSPPYPVTPGSGACLLRSREFVAGLSQMLGMKEAPAMTSFHTPRKNKPICKNPEVRGGGLANAGCEGGASWSVFLLRQCGPAGQPGPAWDPAPSLRGASGRASREQGWEAPGGRWLWGHFAAQWTG